MACGNNKVSRAALQTQPVQLTHPATTAVDQAVRQRAAEAGRAADRQISQATVMMSNATTAQDVRSALQSAQKALDDARRAGGDKNAKSRIRDLERQVEGLRRTASTKEADIAAKGQMQISAMRDSLGRQSLGVPARRFAGTATVRSAESDTRSSASPQSGEQSTDIRQAQRGLQKAARQAVNAPSLADLERLVADAAKTLGEVLKKADTREQQSLRDRFKALERKAAERKAELEVVHLTRDTKMDPQSLRPDTTYEYNGITYSTDSKGFVSHIEGELKLSEDHRHLGIQRDVGHRGGDRHDGGHMFRPMFGGHPSGPNLVPQARDVNQAQGQWWKLEDTWLSHLTSGDKVHASIDLVGDAERPTDIVVAYTINGEPYDIAFPNENFRVEI